MEASRQRSLLVGLAALAALVAGCAAPEESQDATGDGTGDIASRNGSIGGGATNATANETGAPTPTDGDASTGESGGPGYQTAPMT